MIYWFVFVSQIPSHPIIMNSIAGFKGTFFTYRLFEKSYIREASHRMLMRPQVFVLFVSQVSK